MAVVTKLIYARRAPLLRRPVRQVLAWFYGVQVSADAEIGPGLEVRHRGFGLVVEPLTSIGENVTVYSGVTVGAADPWAPPGPDVTGRVVIEDDVVLCAGARILYRSGVLRVGRGTVIGANAVLLQSTGDLEVWAGAPARRVGMRAAIPSGARRVATTNAEPDQPAKATPKPSDADTADKPVRRTHRRS